MLTLQSFQTSYWFIRLHSNRNSTFIKYLFSSKKRNCNYYKSHKKESKSAVQSPQKLFFFFFFTYINKQSMKPRASAMQDSSILNEEDKFWLKTAWTKNNVLGKQVEKT